MSTNTRNATLMLVLVTVLWGLSFPLMKTWQNKGKQIQRADAATQITDLWELPFSPMKIWENMGKQEDEKDAQLPVGALLSGSTLIAIRMFLAAGVLAALQPRLATQPALREHGYGAILGLIFVAGFVFQVWALGYKTTPAISAFITSLGSAWAPLIAWICLGIRAPMLTVIGLAIGVAGTARLAVEPESAWVLLGEPMSWGAGGFGRGEALTLVASVLFGVQILSLDRIGRRVRPEYLTLGFFVVGGMAALLLAVGLAVAGPGLGEWLHWSGTMLGKGEVALTLAVLVLLPTILAFHWMNIYQPCVSATRAALIYLLEPIFSTCFSIPFGMDKLSQRLIEGGSMILIGNLLVELWPRSPQRDATQP